MATIIAAAVANSRMRLMRPLSTAAASFAVCSTLSKRTVVALVSPISSLTTTTSRGHNVALASVPTSTTALYARTTTTNTSKQPRRSMSSLLPSLDIPEETEQDDDDDDSIRIRDTTTPSVSSWPRFAEKDNLHRQSKLALAQMGLVQMTEIQSKTFDAAAAGRDVLARSRTGTGKTVAFLLPALERIRYMQSQSRHNDCIQMLILCPTRELALQIAEQTKQLTSTAVSMEEDATTISHQVMFGGSSRNVDVDRMKRRIPTILIATPGRIQDHLDNTVLKGNNNNNKSFASLFQHTHLLVLDEMDRLLDMGFRQAVEKILTNLPNKQQRQTLLFSATLPTDVKQVIARNLNSDFVTVDCIHDADPASHTNDLVQQSHVVAHRDELVEATVGVLLHILERDPQAKMIVFFPTTKMVKFYAELFNEGMGGRNKVLELHSGKSQSYRTSASNQFRQVTRESGGGVLFTSDVSARGVDYQDVTHVVQVGMADSRETYIHRLGRTARAGKKGLGILILSDLEARGYLKTLNGLDIQVNTEMQNMVDGAPSTAIVQQLHPVLESIRTGQNPSLEESAQSSYRAMLGYYKSQLKRIGIASSEQLVEFANSYSKQTGLVEVPTLMARTAKNIGLYGVAGIVCDDAGKKASGGGGGGGRGGTSKSNGPRSSNAGSYGYQNTRTPRTEFGSPRTAGGYLREGDGRTNSNPRNDDSMTTTPWRSSAPKKPFGIKRTTTNGKAPEGRDQRWYSSFRDGNTTPPPPPKKEPIMGKSEKWNRRRGKSEWVEQEEKVAAASREDGR